jgi:hypothetical protein
MTKRVMIRPELVGKRGDGLGCGLVADIVVAGNVVNGDVRINFGEDAFEFVNLGGVTGFVDEITSDDDKRWVETIDGGDGELEVGSFLNEICVIGKHPELRIGELNEKERSRSAGESGN